MRTAFYVIEVLALGAVLAGGCNGSFWPRRTPAIQQTVPEPINALLPKKIEIHPFTGISVFAKAGGIKGIDVRIRAIDAYGDGTKAFGQFRFELFQFKPNSPDPKGALIAVWNVDVEKLKVNRRHWKKHFLGYQFKLAWNQPIPIGRKFVLAAVFQSPFTERLFDERVFVSGQ